MKKIGIITFHASHNCGSMLQAYALQHFLKSRLGKENEIIDYSNTNQQRMYSVIYKPQTLKQLIRNCLNLCFYKLLKKHWNDYKEFSDKYFELTKKFYSTQEELKSEQFDYTHIIAGSDQVWNVRAEDNDEAYFLAGIEGGIKVAYAVSLGATDLLQQPNCEVYKDYINKFKWLSVREKNGKKCIETMVEGKEVAICADPTLLLDREEWEPLVGPREIKEKYIFWYAMTYMKDMREIVVSISKKMGMPVYVIDAKEWSRRGLYLHGIRVAHNSGPKSFLSLVKNAEIVLTSSFHGTIFSTVFKKNFWYLNLRNEETNDDRASFLLNQLGLGDRYLMKNRILTTDLNVAIDYENLPDIKVLKKESEEFLKNALEN